MILTHQTHASRKDLALRAAHRTLAATPTLFCATIGLGISPRCFTDPNYIVTVNNSNEILTIQDYKGSHELIDGSDGRNAEQGP